MSRTQGGAQLRKRLGRGRNDRCRPQRATIPISPGLQAVDRCRGARWVRCALQVNPYGYLADHGKRSAFADEAAYNAALIEACKKNEVEVIAVTDHYKIDSAAGLISDAEKAGITVFPGFEGFSSLVGTQPVAEVGLA